MRIAKYLKSALVAAAASASMPALALNIVVTNDDGCEASTVHALYQKLTAAGHHVLISASMQDQSGVGGSLAFLRPVTPLTAASRGGNLPAGTPGIATLASVASINYGDRVFCVNSTPVASTLYALDVASKAVFGAPADLVISGPNYGNNTGAINNGSGTVNAALIAVNRGYPAIAVSAAAPTAYRTFGALQPADLEYEHAGLVLTLVNTLIQQTHNGGPFPTDQIIPSGYALNVNFPAYAAGTSASLPWRLANEGSASIATPYFVSDLSTSSVAAGFGLGSVHLPGVSLKVDGRSDPASTGLRFVSDTNPTSEQNVVNSGAIAVSVLQNNHQASGIAKLVVRFKLWNLIKDRNDD